MHECYGDPYITDWRNARDVPLAAGEFGLDEFVGHLIASLEALGPGTHLVATCQAAPPALVAAAVLAQRNPALAPASLTLMAGPIDTRVNKNLINKISDRLPLGLLKSSVIDVVPTGFAGAGRRVYPGFYQLSGFMLLNLLPHIKRHASFFGDIVHGRSDAASTFREFYDEYFAVLDMAEVFYLESLQRIFFEHHIPRGLMTFEGAPVNFGLVEMPLLTIEGEKDNMCSLGQTRAAHDVCPNIADEHRAHHVQPGVGHYGVFAGSQFQDAIYPVARDFIFAANQRDEG